MFNITLYCRSLLERKQRLPLWLRAPAVPFGQQERHCGEASAAEGRDEPHGRHRGRGERAHRGLSGNIGWENP